MPLPTAGRWLGLGIRANIPDQRLCAASCEVTGALGLSSTFDVCRPPFRPTLHPPHSSLSLSIGKDHPVLLIRYLSAFLPDSYQNQNHHRELFCFGLRTCRCGSTLRR